LLLEGNGFQIVGMAFNGQMAIDKFRALSKKPKILIMDYRMPIKNGIEAAIEILNLGNRSKIIFATADVSIKEHALEIGVFKVVHKPFDFDELLNSINEALNEKRIKI